MPAKSNDLELIPAGEKLPVHSSGYSESDPSSIIKYAIDKGANVDVIERLMAVREKLQAEASKRAFDEAMASFQAECPVIVKNKAGAKNAYRYAPLDEIVSQVREIIRRHGFSFGVTSVVDAGWLMAQCKITHSAGHSEVSEFKVPIDTKNPMMTDPQRYGGAMTFAKRYAFCNGFGILTADEDTDGSTTRVKPQGPSTRDPDTSVKPLATELWHLLGDICKGDKDWVRANQWLWREEILDGAVPEEAPNLTAARFREVIAKAKERISR